MILLKSSDFNLFDHISSHNGWFTFQISYIEPSHNVEPSHDVETSHDVEPSHELEPSHEVEPSHDVE